MTKSLWVSEAVCLLGHLPCELQSVSSAFSSLPPSCFPCETSSLSLNINSNKCKIHRTQLCHFWKRSGRRRKKGEEKKKKEQKEGRKQKKDAHNLFELHFADLLHEGMEQSQFLVFWMLKLMKKTMDPFFFFFKGHVHTQNTSPPPWRVHGF